MSRLLRIVVVEDQPTVRQHLADTLSADADVQVVATCANGIEAVSQILALSPDLVFLDVEMPGLSGFDVIEAVGPAEMPPVVFVTAYDDYAVQAFAVEALDYVLKPASAERLRDAVARARRRLGAGHSTSASAALAAPAIAARRTRFAIRVDGSVLFVPYAEVSWLEAAGNYVVVHAGAARHIIREPLSSLAQRLGSGFHRIHRGAIVNVSHVRALRSAGRGVYDVVLGDGERLRVSRQHLAAVQEALATAP